MGILETILGIQKRKEEVRAEVVKENNPPVSESPVDEKELKRQKRNAYARAYYRTHLDKIKQHQANWRAKNKQNANEYSSRYKIAKRMKRRIEFEAELHHLMDKYFGSPEETEEIKQPDGRE